ncbi:MAG: VOC family protein [Dongiaceae bacterium]
MRKSGLRGFIFDCKTDDVDGAAKFWSQALRLPLDSKAYPADAGYRQLGAGPGGMNIELQQVDHPIRVHLDIESDDVEAEVKRLEGLGAKTAARV